MRDNINKICRLFFNIAVKYKPIITCVGESNQLYYLESNGDIYRGNILRRYLETNIINSLLQASSKRRK